MPTGLDLDTQLAAHLLLTLAEEAGRLVLTEPETYPPERIATFAEALTQLALRVLNADKR